MKHQREKIAEQETSGEAENAGLAVDRRKHPVAGRDSDGESEQRKAEGNNPTQADVPDEGRCDVIAGWAVLAYTLAVVTCHLSLIGHGFTV